MAFGRRIRRWWKRVTTPPPTEPGKPLGRWMYKTVLIEISPSLSSEQRDGLREAVTFWNKHCAALFFWANGGLKAELGYPPRDGIVTVSSHPPAGGPEVVATAELFFYHQPGGPIRGAHIEVRPGVPREQFARALAHELGHVLGLGHTRNPDGHLMSLTQAKQGWVLLEEELAYVRDGRG